LRTSAIGALAFTVLYLAHRILQGTGPNDSTAAVVAAYNAEHRGTLLASEVAVGLALLAFIPFVGALVGVADSNEPAAVLALNQLQGRTPIVWTVTARVAAISLAIQRTNLIWRWLGLAGLIVAAIFLVGSFLSMLGRTPEENSSLIAVGLFIAWMLVLSAGLWRTASSARRPG
jgi:hypothetical protein